jgi:hypothetical protein
MGDIEGICFFGIAFDFSGLPKFSRPWVNAKAVAQIADEPPRSVRDARIAMSCFRN